MDVKVHKFAVGAVTAVCPKGRHVAMGGVVGEYQAPGAGGKHVVPTGMRRTADDRWTVTAFNLSDKREGHLTAVAYCDSGSVPRAVENIGWGSTTYDGAGRGATATCPTGTVVVGGGFDLHAAPRNISFVYSARRTSATQWHVNSFGVSSVTPAVTAIAYCAPGNAPKVYSTKLNLAAHATGTARATCPAGSSLVFGGVDTPRTGDGLHSARVETLSWTATSATEWGVTAVNVGSRTGALVALAYCR